MPRFGKDGASMLLSPELHGVAKVSIAWVFMYLAATAFVSATKRTPAPGSPSRRPLDNQMVSGIHHMPCLSLTRHIRGAPRSPMHAQHAPACGSIGTIASMAICMSKLTRSSTRSGCTP